MFRISGCVSKTISYLFIVIQIGGAEVKGT